MKTDRTKWNAAMAALMARRKLRSTTGTHPPINKVSDCKSHLSKVHIGKTLLDVGCGSMSIRAMLPEGVHYTGIDAFPYNDEVTYMEIEYCTYPDTCFETLVCFAVLDGLHDLDKALFHMKRICKKNIVLLTGIGIEPDEFHTFKITEEYLSEQFKEWSVTYKEYLNDRVILIEYTK